MGAGVKDVTATLADRITEDVMGKGAREHLLSEGHRALSGEVRQGEIGLLSGETRQGEEKCLLSKGRRELLSEVGPIGAPHCGLRNERQGERRRGGDSD